MPRWNLDNVLVAGRRLSGSAGGKDEREAVRRFAAAKARELGADVSAAISTALADRLRKASPAPERQVQSARYITPDELRSAISHAASIHREADALLPDAADYSNWPAMRRRMGESRASKDSLRRDFIGRNDKFWGIVDDGEDGGSYFGDSGISGVQCTGYACALQSRLGPGRVKVYGFFGDDNPASEIGRLAGGHDFAVVDDRFIVDPWLVDVESLSPEGVFDLQADAKEVKRLYGDRSKWKLRVQEKEESDFRSWFAGSKVVDKQGKPLRMYHGTRPSVGVIKQFKPERFSEGTYFTSDPDYAESFSDGLFGDDIGKTGGIHPVYLAIKNPKVFKYDGEEGPEHEAMTYRGFSRKELIAQGYDGAIEFIEPYNEVIAVAFHASQIRSAIGNRAAALAV